MKALMKKAKNLYPELSVAEFTIKMEASLELYYEIFKGQRKLKTGLRVKRRNEKLKERLNTLIKRRAV